MMQLLCSSDQKSDTAVESTLQFLQMIFRSAIYGTLRTWIPGAQDSTLVRLTIDLNTGKVVEDCIDHTPQTVPRMYRKRK